MDINEAKIVNDFIHSKTEKEFNPLRNDTVQSHFHHQGEENKEDFMETFDLEKNLVQEQ